jgi:hypothetical protein
MHLNFRFCIKLRFNESTLIFPFRASWGNQDSVRSLRTNSVCGDGGGERKEALISLGCLHGERLPDHIGIWENGRQLCKVKVASPRRHLESAKLSNRSTIFKLTNTGIENRRWGIFEDEAECVRTRARPERSLVSIRVKRLGVSFRMISAASWSV